VFHGSIGYAPGTRNPCGMLKRVILITRITTCAFSVYAKRPAGTSAKWGTFVRYERKGEMPQQRRQGTIRNAGTGGILALLIGMLTVLTACAGPGGDGLSTISAASTVGGALTTATPSDTRTASTGTAASSTVAAAGGSSVASPNAAGSAVARTPAAVGSAVSVGSQTAGAGSATSGTRPATSGSATPGVASATARAVTTGGSATTGSATAAGAGTATRAGSATASRAAGTAGPAGTMAASTGSATIPPPLGGTEYVKGTNPIIDTILQGASEGLNSSSETVTVTSSKSYTSTSSAADVVAAYQKQMPTLGWTPEQNQAANSGITTLVYSRDNQTNAALLLVVDLAQVGQKGCLVITALAKPK